jgi:hypothetical protein
MRAPSGARLGTAAGARPRAATGRRAGAPAGAARACPSAARGGDRPSPATRTDRALGASRATTASGSRTNGAMVIRSRCGRALGRRGLALRLGLCDRGGRTGPARSGVRRHCGCRSRSGRPRTRRGWSACDCDRGHRPHRDEHQGARDQEPPPLPSPSGNGAWPSVSAVGWGGRWRHGGAGLSAKRQPRLVSAAQSRVRMDANASAPEGLLRAGQVPSFL